MGVDPVSMFVAALVVAALVKRVPGIVADLAEAAARGDAADRLRAAGVDSADDGTARRYFENLWRDTWLDLDAKRKAKRAKRDSGRQPTDSSDSGRSWLDRLADKVDAKVGSTADRWRSGPNSDGDGDRGTPRPGESDYPQAPHATWDPPADDTTTEVPWTTDQPLDHDPLLPPWPQPRPASVPPPPSPDTGATPVVPGVTEPAGDSGPSRPNYPSHPSSPRSAPEAASTVRGSVVATLERNDDPAPSGSPNALEGEVMTAVVPARGGAVTGGTSGAAEAKAIQRAVEDANSAYVAAMEAIKHRIVSLGEQTLSQVQMAQRSHVVQLTVQAAEAAAAAQAAAKRCGNEVGPILGQVARAFQRLLS